MKWFGRFCAIVLVFSQAGCAGFLLGVDPDGGAPASAQDYWRPPADSLSGISELSGQEPTSFVKPDQLGAIEQEGGVGLAQMIDLALRNGPTTRQTWAAARAQAAMVGTDQGAYYPQISMDGSMSYSRGIAASGADSFAERQLGPEWQMSWLLFDFGGREARVRAALAELAAANWAHNQALLDTVLNVVQSYYSYLGARKQVAESKLSVANATESMTVAEARMKENIGTAYDSLQAQTTLAQIQIQLERYRGQVDVAAGNLALLAVAFIGGDNQGFTLFSEGYFDQILDIFNFRDTFTGFIRMDVKLTGGAAELLEHLIGHFGGQAFILRGTLLSRHIIHCTVNGQLNLLPAEWNYES